MSDKFRIAVVVRIKKHGALHEAVKKRGWTNKRAAEFLGVTECKMGLMMSMRELPPYIFTKRTNSRLKEKLEEKAAVLSGKLMELTGMTIEELFPKKFLTPKFLRMPKIIAGIRDVPMQTLLGTGAIPQLSLAPDEALAWKEAEQVLEQMVAELPKEQRRIVVGLYFEGRTPRQLAQRFGVGKSAISAAIKTARNYLTERISHYKDIEEKSPWFDPRLIRGRIQL